MSVAKEHMGSERVGARGLSFIDNPSGSQCQLEFTFVRQLLVLRILDAIQDCVARLSDNTDNGVGPCPRSARQTAGMMVNLLANFEGVCGSFHATV